MRKAKMIEVPIAGGDWCGLCSRRIGAGNMRRHVNSKVCREGHEERQAYLFWVGKQPPRILAERGYLFSDVVRMRGQYIPIYLSQEDAMAQQAKDFAEFAKEFEQSSYKRGPMTVPQILKRANAAAENAETRAKGEAVN
jgi:hypothetical protein